MRRHTLRYTLVMDHLNNKWIDAAAENETVPFRLLDKNDCLIFSGAMCITLKCSRNVNQPLKDHPECSKLLIFENGYWVLIDDNINDAVVPLEHPCELV